jgi:hypothetical protein
MLRTIRNMAGFSTIRHTRLLALLLTLAILEVSSCTEPITTPIIVVTDTPDVPIIPGQVSKVLDPQATKDVTEFLSPSIAGLLGFPGSLDQPNVGAAAGALLGAPSGSPGATGERLPRGLREEALSIHWAILDIRRFRDVMTPDIRIRVRFASIPLGADIKWDQVDYGNTARTIWMSPEQIRQTELIMPDSPPCAAIESLVPGWQIVDGQQTLLVQCIFPTHPR